MQQAIAKCTDVITGCSLVILLINIHPLLKLILKMLKRSQLEMNTHTVFVRLPQHGWEQIVKLKKFLLHQRFCLSACFVKEL